MNNDNINVVEKLNWQQPEDAAGKRDGLEAQNNKLFESPFELAGRVIDELKAQNKMLLNALKEIHFAAHKTPGYFTSPNFRLIYSALEKAKEAIKKADR